LSKVDLCGADLCEADLYGVNLCRADLCEADLYGVNLCSVNLQDANLTNAKGIVCLGTDHRGYRFVGVRYADGWRISDDCQWFTIDEAKAHWANNSDALARISTLDKLAGNI
jgi:hypothetical protein